MKVGNLSLPQHPYCKVQFWCSFVPPRCPYCLQTLWLPPYVNCTRRMCNFLYLSFWVFSCIFPEGETHFSLNFPFVLSLEVLVQILLFIQAVRANQNLGYCKDLKGEKLLNFAKITLSLTDLFKLEKNWCCYILTSFSHHSNSTIFSEILSDLQLHMKGN